MAIVLNIDMQKHAKAMELVAMTCGKIDKTFKQFEAKLEECFCDGRGANPLMPPKRVIEYGRYSYFRRMK